MEHKGVGITLVQSIRRGYVVCAVLMPTASSIVRERLELFLTSGPVLSVVLIVVVVWAALLI